MFGVPPEPYDRLMTLIGLAGSSLRCSTTQSTAAMTCETSTVPLAVPTLIEVSFAPGRQPDGAGGGVVADDDAGHVGAVAVAVEIAQVGRLRLEGQVGPVDDLARPAARRPARRRCRSGPPRPRRRSAWPPRRCRRR